MQQASAILPHLFLLVQEVLPGVCHSLVQPIKIGSHSHEVAVHIVQNDLQGGLLPLLGRGWGRGLQAIISLDHSLQALHQLIILLQRLLKPQYSDLNQLQQLIQQIA